MPPQSSEQARWFAEEVQPHERSLRSYLSRSLPSAADVDDIVQDSYTRLLRAKEKDVIRATKPLLFAIARNAVRDFLSHGKRTAAIPITENAVLPVLEDGPGVVESVCRRQELAILEEAIEALPERCREVTLLRKIKGRSQREIAELLGISENTVESLAVKGARRIADYLAARSIGTPENDHGPQR